MSIQKIKSNTLAPNAVEQYFSDNSVTTSFKNHIINGAFDIWQRGTSGFTTHNIYTADRWWFVNDTVGNSSVSRIDISSLGLGSVYALRAERTSETNRWVVGTNLETHTLNQLKGKTVTLSLKLRKGSALTSNITVSFGTQNQEAKYGSLVDNGSFTVQNSSLNSSTFTTFTRTLTIPANTAALGIKVELVATQAGASGAYFDVTDVQLEEGSVATPFERRPIGTELSLCERYYEKSYAVSVAPGTITTNNGWAFYFAATGGSAGGFSCTWRTRKRAAPTVVVYSTITGASGQINAAGTDVSATISQPSEVSAFIYSASSTNNYWHTTASAEL